jgi:predicted HTH domain antitoxin
MSFIVELPDSVAEALRLAPADAEAEVRKELALALYARGILGFGKARELCGLTKWQFEELLGRRKVIRPYDEDDLAVDLAYARRSQWFLTTDSFGEDRRRSKRLNLFLDFIAGYWFHQPYGGKWSRRVKRAAKNETLVVALRQTFTIAGTVSVPRPRSTERKICWVDGWTIMSLTTIWS